LECNIGRKELLSLSHSLVQLTVEM